MVALLSLWLFTAAGAAPAAPESVSDTTESEPAPQTDSTSPSADAPAPPPTPNTAEADPPTPVDDDDDDDGQIVVYGEHLVEQARQAVANDLIEQGFDDVKRKEGYTLYRHDSVWKGEVEIHDDGWIRMRRQPVQFRPPSNSKLGWVTCIAVPFCVQAGGQSVSKRKHMAQRRRTLGNVEPLARMYGDRVADLHVDQQLNELPDRLTALWENGTSLYDSNKTLRTPKQRKLALLDYWESRTETLWGFRVRASVEAFIREVVQDSEHRFTDQEIRAFNADRRTATALDLDRPWDAVLADLEERAGQ
ncbi:MAG: hypothetical protein AB8H79_21470 [Myxococcota bacterium]